MSSPTKTELTFAEKVQADKKSLLERAFSADLLKFSRNVIISKPINNPVNDNENKDGEKENTATQNTNILTSKEFAEIFGDEDVDDSEEIFQKALKKAEELFEREMKIKETNPFYRSSRQFLNPRPQRARKQKSKFIRDTENIINTFRKNLMTPKDSQKFTSTTGTTLSTQKSSWGNPKSLTKNISIVNRPSAMRRYPIWKTTATNTPIFRAPTNPKWGKDRLNTPQLPDKSKMYTPGHINEWMDDISSADYIGPPPCKKTRSDITTHDLASNEDKLLSSMEKPLASSTPMNNLDVNSKRLSSRPIENPVYSISPMHSNTVYCTGSPQIAIQTPAYLSTPVLSTTVQFNKSSPQKQIDSPVYSSTPVRSTTVRFRPSPPEHFIYSDGNSTVSSNSLILEEDDLNQYKNNNFNSDVFYSSEDENEGNIQISPANVEKLNHKASFFNEDFKNPRKYEVFKKYERGHLINNDVYEADNQNIPENSTNPKIFFENFVQNLKYNISNNYQMEVEYSMKLKYSK